MVKRIVLVAAVALPLAGGLWFFLSGVGREAAAAEQEAAVPPPPPHPGAEVKAELEALDAQIQGGLEELTKATAEFAADHKKWQALDRSMASARTVNGALLARNKAVVALYESRLESPLSRFRERLTAAPAIYRKMAEERRQLLAAATLEVERRNYLAMIQTCEAAAILCETRREELFGEGSPEAGFGNRTPRSSAVSLQRTIENMRKLQPMHDKWEETFKAYPTALESPGLKNWFDALSLYGEDLESFTKGVEQLKDSMKRKASGSTETAKPE